MSSLRFHSRLLAAMIVLHSLAFSQPDNIVLANDNIINSRVETKVNEMAAELKEKTGIAVYLAAKKSYKDGKISHFIDELKKDLKGSYVILALLKEEHKVDIFCEENSCKFFDKNAVLSPYPWSGTILPLLTQKKDVDNYNVALLNGYADIVEQIAQNKGIVLKSAIGSSNKSFLAWIKLIIYSAILFGLFAFTFKKIRNKNEKKD